MNVTSDHRRKILRAAGLGLILFALTATVPAQESAAPPGETPALAAGGEEESSPASAKVDIKPLVRDEEIAQRLQKILLATNWFTSPQVRVEEGVVFLSGRAESDPRKKWAGDLARNTQDVVAVVNQMEVLVPSVWDFGPAWRGLFQLWRDFIRSLPFLAFALLILLLSLGAAVLATRGARGFFQKRIKARILRNVIARGIGVIVFLFGAYIVLRVSGLTQLALTVVGGTGLIGLAFGIAFRDITENFLASIFLSMQRPFQTGDLVEVADVMGYVQQLNVRTTILMTIDGNLVQIPNSTVYKSNLRNFTTNANRRDDFIIGIGYDDSINEAQEIARNVLAEHSAVLQDPEPWVLVDSLGQATVNLRVYFWLNGREYSWLKVRSSVIRLVKRAFQKHGISMPDEAREVIFPQGVSVRMLEESAEDAQVPRPKTSEEEQAAVSTAAEAGLYSEAGVLEEQARQAQPLQEGENLLGGAPGKLANSSPNEIEEQG